jgi:hypothetical protein
MINGRCVTTSARRHAALSSADIAVVEEASGGDLALIL